MRRCLSRVVIIRKLCIRNSLTLLRYWICSPMQYGIDQGCKIYTRCVILKYYLVLSWAEYRVILQILNSYNQTMGRLYDVIVRNLRATFIIYTYNNSTCYHGVGGGPLIFALSSPSGRVFCRAHILRDFKRPIWFN